MAQQNPPGRKKGDDLLTEDPEYKRKDRERTDDKDSREDNDRTREKENVNYEEDRRDEYGEQTDIERDGRRNPRSKDEAAVDDDEDEVL